MGQRFRDTVKQKYNDYSLGLTEEQVQRIRNTPISKKQMENHDKNDEIISTKELVQCDFQMDIYGDSYRWN